MDWLLIFVLRNGFWIVLICALALGWQLLKVMGSGRQRRMSSFGLERSQLARQRNGAIRSIIGLIMVIVGVTWATLNLEMPTTAFAPSSRFSASTNLTDDDTEVTPARLISTRSVLPTGTPLIAPTATLQDAGAIPVAGATPTPAVLDVRPLIEGCDDNAVINEPPSGETVSGGVSVFGRATAEDFGRYSLEIRGAQTGNEWDFLTDDWFEPVDNGFLGTGELFNWLPGIYQIRLTIFDVAGGEVSRCLIQIGVES